MSSIPSSARRSFKAVASAARASSREAAAAEPPRRLAELSARNSAGPSFEQRVGRTEIVVSGTRSRGGGFYCAECDSLHKDSNRYLAHINGRAHLKKIGLSTRARRATLEEVLQAFEVERRRARGEDPPRQLPTERKPELREEEKARADLGLPVLFGAQ